MDELVEYKIVYRSGEVQFIKAVTYQEVGSLTKFLAPGGPKLGVPTKDIQSISLPEVPDRYMPPPGCDRC
jgi:hypothetical protein